MQLFTINTTYTVICDTKSTRSGFKHTAALLKNGREIEEVKCIYYNRTWERYTYESVLYKLVEACDKAGNVPLADRYTFYKKVKNNFQEEEEKKSAGLARMVSTIAAFTDITATSLKDKNASRKRMLLAAYPLSFPDNWEELPEEEKERRLDQVIKNLE